MLDFIAKYWLEFALGLLAAGLVALVKYLVAAVRRDIRENMQKIADTSNDDIEKTLAQTVTNTDELKKDIKDVHTILQHHETGIARLEARVSIIEQNLDAVKKGMLTMQGKQFKDECRAILHSDKPVDIETLEELVADYDTYKALGGNHNGDMLYSEVRAKYHSQWPSK